MPPVESAVRCRMKPNPKVPYGRSLLTGMATKMLGINVTTLPCPTPSAVLKKFDVWENSSSEPIPCAPPPPIATAHVLVVEGASPPNTFPIDAVNIACADAGPASTITTADTVSNNRVNRTHVLRIDLTAGGLRRLVAVGLEG